MIEENLKSKLYKMKIGDATYVKEFGTIMRVPGGWIFKQGGQSCAICFVPFVNRGDA